LALAAVPPGTFLSRGKNPFHVYTFQMAGGEPFFAQRCAHGPCASFVKLPSGGVNFFLKFQPQNSLSPPPVGVDQTLSMSLTPTRFSSSGSGGTPRIFFFSAPPCIDRRHNGITRFGSPKGPSSFLLPSLSPNSLHRSFQDFFPLSFFLFGDLTLPLSPPSFAGLPQHFSGGPSYRVFGHPNPAFFFLEQGPNGSLGTPPDDGIFFCPWGPHAVPQCGPLCPKISFCRSTPGPLHQRSLIACSSQHGHRVFFSASG